MQVREFELPLIIPPPKTPRSVGVHVSGIIRCIATEHGILKSEWAEELSLVDVRVIEDPVAVLRICVGLAWEEWYIPQILGPIFDAVDHPREMEVDGIYCTHDAESLSFGPESLSVIITDRRMRLAGHEVKATWKSTRTVGDLSTQWMWITQMKAYCKCIGTTLFYMHTLFLCGDYTYPIKPILKHWEIEFTQEEIDSNWNDLRDYRDQRIRMNS